MPLYVQKMEPDNAAVNMIWFPRLPQLLRTGRGVSLGHRDTCYFVWALITLLISRSTSLLFDGLSERPWVSPGAPQMLLAD